MIDAFLNIKFVVKSQVYLSQTPKKQEEINKTILAPLSEYSAYVNKRNQEKEDEKKNKNEKYKDVKKIRLITKEGGDNYASCAGTYTLDPEVKINGCNPYVNVSGDRFIGKTGDNWTLTGMEWFRAIIDECKEKDHYFGGFHGSMDKEPTYIALSKWKEYEVIICDDDNRDDESGDESWDDEEIYED